MSRRTDPVRLAALATLCGVLPLIVYVALVPGSFGADAIRYGMLAGASGAVGLLLLYAALAAGPMGVVSPITAVLAAAVPVAAGLARGERPGTLAYSGMALAIVAIVLVSVQPDRDDDATHQALAPRTLAVAIVSGVSIGLYLTFIGLAPPSGGLWPVLVARLTTSVIVVALAVVQFRRQALLRSIVGIAFVIGAVDATANVLFRLAAQSGQLAVVSVLGALYPAGTVVLARIFLHERLRPVQQVGMVAALAAAGLLSIPG